jgi:hypothetical protein
MTTTPTQNSVPSESPIDLKFNAGKIDEFVTSLVHQYIDRFGVQHYTIEGLRWLAQQAIAQYGWIPYGTFQAGATLTLPNQILKDTTDGIIGGWLVLAVRKDCFSWVNTGIVWWCWHWCVD